MEQDGFSYDEVKCSKAKYKASSFPRECADKIGLTNAVLAVFIKALATTTIFDFSEVLCMVQSLV